MTHLNSKHRVNSLSGDLYVNWDTYNKAIEELATQIYEDGYEFNQKISTLREKANNYQKQRREKFDEINAKRNKATEEVMKTLNPILSAYAEQNGISIMVEKKSIVVGKNEFDVSTAIIEELNKQLSSIKLD